MAGGSLHHNFGRDGVGCASAHHGMLPRRLPSPGRGDGLWLISSIALLACADEPPARPVTQPATQPTVPDRRRPLFSGPPFGPPTSPHAPKVYLQASPGAPPWVPRATPRDHTANAPTFTPAKPEPCKGHPARPRNSSCNVRLWWYSALLDDIFINDALARRARAVRWLSEQGRRSSE